MDVKLGCLNKINDKSKLVIYIARHLRVSLKRWCRSKITERVEP